MISRKINSIREIKEESCVGCGACVNKCDNHAVRIRQNKNGFYKAIVDDSLCANCGKCKSVCPLLAGGSNSHFRNPKLFVFNNPSQHAIMSATAGGFQIIANKMAEDGAHVTGATWNEKWECVYIFADKKEELKKLYKSKYVQSKTGDIYKKTEDKLKNGITVLFSGLPCHVAGLYSYLGKDYDNLYTIDLLCNNVPSIKVLHRFLDERFGLDQVKHIDFRYKEPDKETNDFRMCIETETETFVLGSDNLYYRAFVERKFAGKHCENCKFGALPRVGDLSLGDIYGAEKEDARFAPLKTESVLINSKKGERLVRYIKDECREYREIPLDIIKQMHPILHSTWPVSSKRDQAYEMLERYSFEQACRAVVEEKYDVGIVGVATNPNYGGALTYLALKWILENLDKTCLMIIPPGDDLLWLPKRITNFRKNPYSDYEIVCYPDKESMKELNDKCDMFMVGSDQLFSTHYINNGIYAECNEFASLDWVFDRKKKVAYAASFGEDSIHCPSDMKGRMAYYLNKFDSFAVREQSAIKLCEEEFGMAARWVLDPVFLVDKKKYIDLVMDIPFARADLFSYILDVDDESKKIIQDILKEKKYSLSCIGDSAIKRVAYIEEWLGSVINAKFIITDSFHCACFAVIFNVPFIVIQNKNRGKARYGLFHELGLGNRVIASYEEYLSGKDNLLKNIDWDCINEKIKYLKNDSMTILREQLEPQKKISSGYDILDAKYHALDAKCGILDARISAINENIPKLLFYETVVKRMYDGMMNMIGGEDCVVFGTGDFGERCTRELNRRGIKIKYYIDNDERKQNRFFLERNVYSPKKLLEEKHCVVMIATFDFAGDMKRQLEKMQLNDGVKILYYIDLGEEL